MERPPEDEAENDMCRNITTFANIRFNPESALSKRRARFDDLSSDFDSNDDSGF